MAQSFLEVARELIDSPEAKAAYADDPSGFMAARGLDGLSAADLEDAVGFVTEAVPAPVARQLATPPGSVADPAPLARLAAASTVDAAVVDVEPGTVDLTALVDPSGQFDLPGPATDDIPVIEEEEGEERAAAEADEPEEEEEPPTEIANGDAVDAFGAGADDEEDDNERGEEQDDEQDGAESPADARSGAEPDPIGANHEVDPELDELEPTDASPLRPVEPPDEPHEDEFEEMI